MNKTSFIQQLNYVHDQNIGSNIDDRFIEISKKVSIYPYLVQYLGADELPPNSFIGMNVRTSKIIPFFTFKNTEGFEANKRERNNMLKTLNRITTQAKEIGGFFSYPDFLEVFKLEYLDLIISRKNDGKYRIKVISARDFFQDNKSLTERNEIKEFLENISYPASFLDSWYNSIIRVGKYANKDVHAVVKVSDPDLRGKGNSFYVIITPDQWNDESNISSTLSKSYCIPLLDVMSIIKTLYINDVNELVKKEAIKSAISAIMSRNMSHNLGSHYLFYTKNKLEELAEISGHTGPYIRGAAKVMSYIQGRMDYLATIVANDKYPYGSVNFKSQIWDELTIDDFSKRHYGVNPDEEFSRKIKENSLQLEAVRILTSELAALYENCDSLHGNNLTNRREQIDTKLKELSKQLEVLDNKSIYSRTTNYLLTNLIRSENYSRKDVLDNSIASSYKPLYLHVKLWNEDGHYELFSGSNDPKTMEYEEGVKDRLSMINLALPGGTMSCHAFYNILENFIRNSAKYSWTDNQPDELRFTISLRINKSNQRLHCILFDNKHDALKSRDTKHSRTLLEDIRTRLRHTNVLGINNAVDKDNKGLKEMLFSAVWLKANEQNKSFADIISEIENAQKQKKLKLIKQYAFEFVSVNDDGEYCTDPSTANLGVKIVFPLFTQIESLQGKTVQDLIKLHTDVIEVPCNYDSNLFKGRSCEQIFTRVFKDDIPSHNEIPNYLSPVENAADDLMIKTYKLLQAVKHNIAGFDNYRLLFDTIREPGWSSQLSPSLQIKFDTHFSTKASKGTLLDYYGKYAYVDTISGNNFTKTLYALFASGINRKNKCYKGYNNLYLAIKIKESCLTRITIIDERLFNSVRWDLDIEQLLKDKSISNDKVVDIRSTACELSMKNIRVLNYVDQPIKRKKNNKCHKVDKLPFLHGNEFLPTGPYSEKPNSTNFLSIHLGLIEKLLKSPDPDLEKEIGRRGDNPYDTGRIKKLMEMLKKHFGNGIPNGVHICIHSGRGNFSKELEGPLKEYPFISLAALESAFNNSKYLLTQLFYNTIFIGKGEVNH